MAELSDFLARATMRRFEWGSWDCLLWLADWIVERRGVDPAAEYRGHYRTRLGARRILKREGGMEGLTHRCAEALSLTPCTPRAGAVGLVLAWTGKEFEPVGALHTGWRWQVLTGAGLAAGPADALACWEV